MAAASVLSYRLPANPNHMDIIMALEQSTMFSDGRVVQKFSPGQLTRYNGPINSLILEENGGGNPSDTTYACLQNNSPLIEISSRDFLASLHRMIALNNIQYRRQFDNKD